MIQTDENITCRISNEENDPLWDNFVASQPGGYHEQTIPWAIVRKYAGWSSRRIILENREKITAGAQILFKYVKPLGEIGHIPYGPCIAGDSPEIAGHLLSEIIEFVKKEKIRYLVIVPPYYGDYLLPVISALGFRPVIEELFPGVLITSTTLIDLIKPLTEILSEMKLQTRYNIKYAIRKGIQIREGSKNDIGTFFELMVDTCTRRKTKPTHPDKKFFEILWDLFHEKGWVRLHLAEYNQENVCAALSFSFGDTFRIWKFGWSGKYGSLNPSNALYWRMIELAKSEGYRYIDLVSVDTEISKAMESGREITPALKARYFYGATVFKMGFGGKLLHLPYSYCYVPSPVLRFLFNTFGRSLLEQSWFNRLINLIFGARNNRVSGGDARN